MSPTDEFAASLLIVRQGANKRASSPLYLQAAQCYFTDMQRLDSIISKPNMPQVAIIVAMTENHVIGSAKNIPWHLPEDLQLFKHLTMGRTLIMGRKTHTSIGRPLPGRNNIVLSRTQEGLPGVEVCDSFIAGLTAAAQYGNQVFVIGGAELYRKALPIASEVHISWVKDVFPGDVYFPDFDLEEWIVCKDVDYSAFHYVHYQRKVPPAEIIRRSQGQ